MREQLSEPLSLDDLAREAFLSRYHFHRIFRSVTGVPPGRFLAALRMEAAKTLLLTTDLYVSDICLEVGYRSLGTFTAHFRQLVGISPSRMRRLTKAHGDEPVASLATPRWARESGAGVTVRVSARDGFFGTAFLGVFPAPLPQARPAECAVVTLPAETELACFAPSPQYLLASAFAGALTIGEALLAHPDDTRIGAVLVAPPAAAIEVELRPMRELDPPILLALPLVLADAKHTQRAVA